MLEGYKLYFFVNILRHEVNHPIEISGASVFLHPFLCEVSVWPRTNVETEFLLMALRYATDPSYPQLHSPTDITQRHLLLELSTLSIDPGKFSIRLLIHVSIYIPFLRRSSGFRTQYFHAQHCIAAQLRARYPGSTPQIQYT